MLHDIQPHQFCNNFTIASNIEENDYIFHFTEDTLLLKQTGDQLDIPRKKDLIGCQQEGTFLFTLNSVRCFLRNNFVQHTLYEVMRTEDKRDVDDIVDDPDNPISFTNATVNALENAVSVFNNEWEDAITSLENR